MGRGPHTLRHLSLAGSALALAALLGCATQFTSGTIRDEIVHQTGLEPLRAFEFDLGGPTLHIARTVMAGSSSGTSLPLAGLERLELAVYDVSKSMGTGKSVDFTRMTVRGWEKVVRVMDGAHSAVVLVRRSDGAIAELVVAVSGPQSAIYGRLKGSLSNDLPAAIASAVRSSGPEGVRDALMSVAAPEAQPSQPEP